ncbi:MAG: hypothetical protein EZS28_021715 [Streblomastix strix]|uniref:Uncharacterized protein n=1 Tax=Streblomastix strix TaxID=222440 RepID=A0A5J4VJW5_9EUKA|nr:MAG: hypothetical protein EZS28_021715 [Streblomastix strix]
MRKAEGFENIQNGKEFRCQKRSELQQMEGLKYLLNLRNNPLHMYFKHTVTFGITFAITITFTLAIFFTIITIIMEFALKLYGIE